MVTRNDLKLSGNLGKVTACLIVKDEEHTLSRCLNTVKDWVDKIVIIDTGSKDNTWKIAWRYAPHSVYKFKWRDDFAAARNYAQSFVETEWCLTLDADDLVKNPEVIPKLIELAKQHNIDGFYSTYKQDTNSFQKRLSLYKPYYLSWEGAVHESLVPTLYNNKNKPHKVRTSYSDLVILHKKPEYRIKRDAEKYLAILLEKEPENWFGLAESYKVLGKFEEAEHYYWFAYNYPQANQSTKYISLVNCAMLNYQLAMEASGQAKRDRAYLADRFTILAIALDETRAEAFTLQGMISEQLGNAKKAKIAYSKAIECPLPKQDTGLVWWRYYREIPNTQLDQLAKEHKQEQLRLLEDA